MGIGGARPTPIDLRLLTGRTTKGKIPKESKERGAAGVRVRKEPLIPPARLTARQKKLWERYIDTAWWLTEHDTTKAYGWVTLQAQFNADPTSFNAAQFGQLRMAGSELGFDPLARARLGLDGKNTVDPDDEFFGR